MRATRAAQTAAAPSRAAPSRSPAVAAVVDTLASAPHAVPGAASWTGRGGGACRHGGPGAFSEILRPGGRSRCAVVGGSSLLLYCTCCPCCCWYCTYCTQTARFNGVLHLVRNRRRRRRHFDWRVLGLKEWYNNAAVPHDRVHTARFLVAFAVALQSSIDVR